MRSFHKNLILFSVLLFAILVVVEVLLSRNLQSHVSLKYDEIYNPKVKADIVILGNSHAGLGVNPRVMKEDSDSIYNFAFGGCNSLYYRIWYEYVFKENYPKPEYVIYAVDWLMFDSTLANRSFDVDIRFMPVDVLVKVLLKEEHVGKKNLVFNRFNLIAKQRKLQHIFYQEEKFNPVEFYHGYVPLEPKRLHGMVKSPKESPMSKIGMREFDRLLDDLEKDGIQIIFVNIPEYIPAWNTNDIEARFYYLDSVAASRSIPYLKYNHELKTDFNEDTTNFRDWIHLTEKGANVFSERLSKDLESIIE